MPYDPAHSEPRWQQAWDGAGTFRAVRDERPKYYVLEMFPYPSCLLYTSPSPRD